MSTSPSTTNTAVMYAGAASLGSSLLMTKCHSSCSSGSSSQKSWSVPPVTPPSGMLSTSMRPGPAHMGVWPSMSKTPPPSESATLPHPASGITNPNARTSAKVTYNAFNAFFIPAYYSFLSNLPFHVSSGPGCYYLLFSETLASNELSPPLPKQKTDLHQVGFTIGSPPPK